MHNKANCLCGSTSYDQISKARASLQLVSAMPAFPASAELYSNDGESETSPTRFTPCVCWGRHLSLQDKAQQSAMTQPTMGRHRIPRDTQYFVHILLYLASISALGTNYLHECARDAPVLCLAFANLLGRLRSSVGCSSAVPPQCQHMSALLSSSNSAGCAFLRCSSAVVVCSCYGWLPAGRRPSSHAFISGGDDRDCCPMRSTEYSRY